MRFYLLESIIHYPFQMRKLKSVANSAIPLNLLKFMDPKRISYLRQEVKNNREYVTNTVSNHSSLRQEVKNNREYVTNTMSNHSYLRQEVKSNGE